MKRSHFAFLNDSTQVVNIMVYTDWDIPLKSVKGKRD